MKFITLKMEGQFIRRLLKRGHKSKIYKSNFKHFNLYNEVGIMDEFKKYILNEKIKKIETKQNIVIFFFIFFVMLNFVIINYFLAKIWLMDIGIFFKIFNSFVYLVYFTISGHFILKYFSDLDDKKIKLEKMKREI